MESPNRLELTLRPRASVTLGAWAALLLTGMQAYDASARLIEQSPVVLQELIGGYLGVFIGLLLLLYRERLRIDSGQAAVSRRYLGFWRTRTYPLAQERFAVPEVPRFMDLRFAPSSWLRLGDLGVTSTVLSRSDAEVLAADLNARIELGIPRLTSASS